MSVEGLINLGPDRGNKLAKQAAKIENILDQDNKTIDDNEKGGILGSFMSQFNSIKNNIVIQQAVVDSYKERFKQSYQQKKKSAASVIRSALRSITLPNDAVENLREFAQENFKKLASHRMISQSGKWLMSVWANYTKKDLGYA